MDQKIAVLFDLDGVIIDTEPQYDLFWKAIGEKYQLGIPNFEQKIKGTTLTKIMSSFFSHLSEEEAQQIIQRNHDYEVNMDMPPVPGALDFLSNLKKIGIKMGLVTSSDDRKLAVVFERLNLVSFFDTVVSADRITQGKPHPMCYLLAAANLGVNPENCIVFEDSFHGIDAGIAAGMRVIGLSTTNSKKSLENKKVVDIIPDFKLFGIDDLMRLFCGSASLL